MSYIEQISLVIDPTFRGRVTMALVHAAQQVTWEVTSTPHHVERIQLARNILASPESNVNRFIYDIASNPTISSAGPSASNDGDLDFVIVSVFDRVALDGGSGAP